MSVDGSNFDTDKYYEFERIFTGIHQQREAKDKTNELYKTAADFLLYHTLVMAPRNIYSKLSSFFCRAPPKTKIRLFSCGTKGNAFLKAPPSSWRLMF